jgi:hypothetical protein
MSAGTTLPAARPAACEASSMRLGRLGTLAVVASLWSLGPAAPASAQCAARPAAEVTAQAEVIVDAVALPGDTGPGVLLSPARFTVERYDKGAGPGTIDVVTGDVRVADGTVASASEAIHVRAGERWRLIGSRDAAGRLVPDCGVNGRVPDEVLPPMIRRGSRWIALARSRYSGRGAIRPPGLGAARLLRLAVRDGDARPAVRLGQRILAARRVGPNRYVTQLPARTGARRLVVQTRWGFWVALVRR